MPTVLGIETSCDETAAAVVTGSATDQPSGTILSNVVHSQIAEHAAFGGVVPEIAARAHAEKLDSVIARALSEAGRSFEDLDAIAVTAGPGLIGGLIVGVMTAAALAAARGLPLFGINHLEGHALTARLTHGLSFPYLMLLVSGGHTQIVQVNGPGDHKRLATTIDDALGEAFDKTAKLLGLPYPGGPAVEKAARAGNPRRFALPRPLKGEARPDFSFSGLKTALRKKAAALQPLGETDIADLCASFQRAVTETLADRVGRALELARPGLGAGPVLVVAGGVAANGEIRTMLESLAAAHGYRFAAPPLALCTDNAAMIAWAGIERIGAGLAPDSLVVPRPRWPLDDVSAPVIGSGRKGARA